MPKPLKSSPIIRAATSVFGSPHKFILTVTCICSMYYTFRIGMYFFTFQTDTLKVRPLKSSSQNPYQGTKSNAKDSYEAQPVILMRAKGNPGILIEVNLLNFFNVQKSLRSVFNLGYFFIINI